MLPEDLKSAIQNDRPESKTWSTDFNLIINGGPRARKRVILGETEKLNVNYISKDLFLTRP
jgi:hypothetical protein